MTQTTFFTFSLKFLDQLFLCWSCGCGFHCARASVDPVPNTVVAMDTVIQHAGSGFCPGSQLGIHYIDSTHKHTPKNLANHGGLGVTSLRS